MLQVGQQVYLSSNICYRWQLAKSLKCQYHAFQDKAGIYQIKTKTNPLEIATKPIEHDMNRLI